MSKYFLAITSRNLKPDLCPRGDSSLLWQLGSVGPCLYFLIPRKRAYSSLGHQNSIRQGLLHSPRSAAIARRMDADVHRVVLELKPSANLDSKLFKLKAGKARGEGWVLVLFTVASISDLS